MEVVFRTKRLQRSYENSASAVQRWGPEVGRKYITRIEGIYAARDLSVLHSSRAMRLHPLKGSRKGELSIYLTGRWRLIVTKGETEEIVVVKEVSNHYED